MIFKNEYDFLSNMYPCPITLTIGGRTFTFTCSESAFQACKCPNVVHLFVPLNGYDAKKLGKKVPLMVTDWNKQRIPIMYTIVSAKFTQHPELIQRLCSIKEDIVEDNTWGDTFWGKSNGIGQNNLGKILMRIRDGYELN